MLPLVVTVTPLRSKVRLADVPWIGVGTPVAIVTVSDPDLDRRRREKNLRSRFSLTSAESRLAVEILKGDGRAAAARRRGISDATAKTQLASISTRPEPTGRLNSFVSCSTPPMRKKWKNERHLRDRRQSRSPDLFVKVAAGIKKLLRANSDSIRPGIPI